MSVRIFGDGLDALFLAAALSKSKIEYSWYHTSDHIGGFFKGGTDCHGQPIDLGMVLLEPNDYGAIRLGVDGYGGESGVNSRPFLSEAYSFLENTFGTLKPVNVLTLDEKLFEFPDYFISDNLGAFFSLSDAIRREMLERLAWTSVNPNWHPKEKYTHTDHFSNIGLEEYFVLIYGRRFYSEYFRSYVTNLLGTKKTSLSANLHRKAWLPIYWPETLLDAVKANQNPSALFIPTFTRPHQGSVARWVASMLEEVSCDDSATVIKRASIDLAEFDHFSSALDFPFLSVEKMTAHSGEPSPPKMEKAVLRMVHFCAKNQSDSVYFLNNKLELCFRYSTYSDQETNSGGVMLEYGESSKEISETELIAHAMIFANKRGIELICKGKVFNGLLPLVQSNSQTMSDRYLKISNQYTIQNPSRVTINDHILRGACAASSIEGLLK
jgi:hypothetical protein